jgi:hypothetical protein
MGLIRKIASASTLGAVKYTSRREAETKERLANAKLAREAAKQLSSSGKDEPSPEILAVEHVEAYLRGDYPKWKMTTRELLLLRKARKETT